MGNDVSYDKLFNLLNTQNIIFFEDDFIFEDNKDSLLYGLVRLNQENRQQMLDEIESGSPELVSLLNEFYEIFKKGECLITDWVSQVAYNDIQGVIDIFLRQDEYKGFGEQLKVLYDKIDFEKDYASIMNSYGAGVVQPDLYDNIFYEYIFKNFYWEKFRVFKEFSSETKAAFEKEIGKTIPENSNIICIIDNQLKEEKRATEIIDSIKKVSSGKRINLLGVIYSSYPNDDKIEDTIYLEYIDKKSVANKLQAACVRSAYSLLLYKLKNVYQGALSASFDEAIKNKDIAYYLAKMASIEGITNYQVITDWVYLLFEYKLKDIRELRDITVLTKLINLLNDGETEFSQEMLKLNTFEAFDYNVNKFYQPISSGDIFADDKGELFILVGQDCDMMVSKFRKGRNGVGELVKATLMLQNKIENPTKFDLEYMYVSNFRESENGDARCIKIKYGTREFLDNQILALCQFNSEGKCRIDLNYNLQDEVDIMQGHYPEQYENLKTYFTALRHLKQFNNDKIETIINDSNSPRLITVLEFDEEMAKSSIIEYPLRRVCRMKHSYILFLYKLYLEYRGRHPFDSINMTRQHELEIEIEGNSDEFVCADIILSPDRKCNTSELQKLQWMIDKEELERVTSRTLNRDVEFPGAKEIIVLKEEKAPYEQIMKDTTGKEIKFIKKKKKLQILEA